MNQLNLDGHEPSIEEMKASIERAAIFSPCRTYRYTLERTWSDPRPAILFVLLNPSTADAEHDDPTNRKCMYWAMRNGFGSLTFCNLFAYRTPDPEVMKAYKEPVGPENDAAILAQICTHDVYVAGWGNDGGHLGRDKQVLGLLPGVPWLCVGTNKNGTPKHPLYMRNDTAMMRYKPEGGA